MKNDRTPRTLADSSFDVGYQSAQPRSHSRPSDWILATCIGAGLALWLVTWWAS